MKEENYKGAGEVKLKVQSKEREDEIKAMYCVSIWRVRKKEEVTAQQENGTNEPKSSYSPLSKHLHFFHFSVEINYKFLISQIFQYSPL